MGTWINVTPSKIKFSGSCNSYGTQTVAVDPARPSDFYAEFNCEGIYKSTDYGLTWNGPINTGTNGAAVSDCAGGITVTKGATPSSPPVIFEACIRGSGLGFWKSIDGGVNWTNYFIANGERYQDVYAPVVDPYDSNHLLIAGHENNSLSQSFDGGQTWSNVHVENGMLERGGTAFVFFVNTGSAATTRNTYLWMAQGSGGTYGTWRTANGGTSWKQVDTMEHPHGAAQMYQPDTSGVIYLAGYYSRLGDGVIRSTDYGQTWTHTGNNNAQTVVFGTSKNIFSMYSWANGPGGIDPSAQTTPQPGTGVWAKMTVPPAMAQGAAQAAVTFDGTHNVIVTSNWMYGLWRYVEP